MILNTADEQNTGLVIVESVRTRVHVMYAGNRENMMVSTFKFKYSSTKI